MAGNGARSGANETRKGFPPASPTEVDPQRPPPSADSVAVEELRVSDLVPVDDVVSRSESMPSHDVHAGTAERTRADFVQLPKGTLVGEYEIEGPIGEGGMGAVYAAVHPVLGKRVAIKIIGHELSRDDNAIARFRREARAVAQLASPHIVDVFGFGSLSDGRAYFIMECLVGESLRARLTRGRIPLDEALGLLDQITRGLEVAHDAGIVHRDLKPENIFIERQRNTPPVVKLLDFGIVKLADGDDDVSKTQAGVLLGTPVYVSPDQIKAASTVDHRADIYSLGCVAFEMILGSVPFMRATVPELIAAHLEVPPPQPRSLWTEIPGALDAMLVAMLAKDPAKRPTLGYIQETIETLQRAARAAAGAPSIVTLNATDVPITVEAPPMSATPLLARPVARVVAASTIVSTRPRSRLMSRRLRLVVGGVIAAMAAIIAFMVAGSGSPDDTLGARPVATPVTSDIDSVRVVPIEPPAPIAPSPMPPTAPEVRPSPPTAAPRPSIVAPKAAQPLPATAPPQVATVPAKGELDINSKPPCDVAIDGVATGRHTPLAGWLVEPGIHRVTLTNDKLGISDTVTVQVLVDKPVRVVKDYMPRPHPVDPNGTIDPFQSGSGKP
jgi:serine/threonine-protein kinase